MPTHHLLQQLLHYSITNWQSVARRNDNTRKHSIKAASHILSTYTSAQLHQHTTSPTSNTNVETIVSFNKPFNKSKTQAQKGKQLKTHHDEHKHIKHNQNKTSNLQDPHLNSLRGHEMPHLQQLGQSSRRQTHKQTNKLTNS